MAMLASKDRNSADEHDTDHKEAAILVCCVIIELGIEDTMLMFEVVESWLDGVVSIPA